MLSHRSSFLCRTILPVFFLSVICFISSCKKGEHFPYRIGVSDCDAPFSYRNENGELTGLEIDIVREIAAENDIIVELVPMSFNDRIEELKKKKPSIDAAVGLITWTKSREDDFQFVRPAFFTSSMSLFTKKERTDINSFDDLKGHKVGVMVNSVEYDYLKYHSDSIGHFDIITYEKMTDGIDLLEKESVDVIYEETYMVLYRMDSHPDVKLAVRGIRNQAITMIIKKGTNDPLRSKGDYTLNNMSQDGRLANLIRKYIGQE